MQWLTAILAFATTMLVFAVVVTALVETIHRMCRTRTSGLKRFLGQFYVEVLQPHIEAANEKLNQNAKIELDEATFIKSMSRVRATSHGWFSKLFSHLTNLPTVTFMERLGSTSFGDLLKEDDAKGKMLLQDIAQKYESFGAESSHHFESGARLLSVFVATFVAWTFYVHPYDLLQSYMKNPEVAVKVAALADDSMETYQKLVDQAEQLKSEQGQDGDTKTLTADDVDKLVSKLKSDIDNAKSKVDQLSNAGAPVGWPHDKTKVGAWRPWLSWFTTATQPDDEKQDAPDNQNKTDNANNDQSQSDSENKAESGNVDQEDHRFAIYYPRHPQDWFWLLMGGLLIGLGAPFWAKLISRLSQAKNVSVNLADILTPQQATNEQQRGTTGAPMVAEDPMTTVAFLAAARSKPAKKETETQ